MTGAFVRVERDGKFVNVEIDQLSDDELERFKNHYSADGWRWAVFLAKWIRDNVVATHDRHDTPTLPKGTE